MPPFFCLFPLRSAHNSTSAAALDPRLWTKARDGMCRHPIPHAIRPSVVDWNNTEALMSRLNLRRLIGRP